MHPYCGFLCDVRWRHSRPPNSEPHVFVNFVALQIDLDAVSAFCQRTSRLDVLYSAVNVWQFCQQVTPQDSQICGGLFFQNVKNRPQSFTVENVINSTDVNEHMRVTISCRYALSRLGDGFGFQFVYFIDMSITTENTCTQMLEVRICGGKDQRYGYNEGYGTVNII